MKNKVASGVLTIGIPSALCSLLMTISNILLNIQMSKYGDMAVAGIGVATKITMMTGMICIGLGQGVLPVLGYCVGANKWERYRKVLRFSVVLALLLSVLLTLVCYLFTGHIVSVFLTAPQAYEYGLKFARILPSTGFLFGVFYVLTSALQACGAAKESLVVSVSRQGLIYIPAMFILGTFFLESGLVWAQPAADVLSLILAFVLYLRVFRKQEKS